MSQAGFKSTPEQKPKRDIKTDARILIAFADALEAKGLPADIIVGMMNRLVEAHPQPLELRQEVNTQVAELIHATLDSTPLTRN